MMNLHPIKKSSKNFIFSNKNYTNKEYKKLKEVRLDNWMLAIIKINFKCKINPKISNFKCMDKSNLSVKGLEFHRMIKIQILSAKSKK